MKSPRLTHQRVGMHRTRRSGSKAFGGHGGRQTTQREQALGKRCLRCRQFGRRRRRSLYPSWTRASAESDRRGQQRASNAIKLFGMQSNKPTTKPTRPARPWGRVAVVGAPVAARGAVVVIETTLRNLSRPQSAVPDRQRQHGRQVETDHLAGRQHGNWRTQTQADAPEDASPPQALHDGNVVHARQQANLGARHRAALDRPSTGQRAGL